MLKKKNRLKERMAIKLALQKILRGILQTEEKNKLTHDASRKNKPH